MSSASLTLGGFPAGGIRRGRGYSIWQWNAGRTPTTVPQRCRGDQWYLLRALQPLQPVEPGHAQTNGRGASLPSDCAPAPVHVRFASADKVLAETCVNWTAVGDRGPRGEWLSWLFAPPKTAAVEISLTNAPEAQAQALELHAVAERDPKCHPLANVPRWTTYQPPFPMERVVLPAELEALAPLLSHVKVNIARDFRSRSALAAAAQNAAIVMAPAWCNDLGLGYPELCQIAARSYVIVDLHQFVRCAELGGMKSLRVQTHTAERELMSARNEYAEVPTRGFALLDTFPFGTINPRGQYALRAIRLNRAWKAMSDELGFATLLGSQTPTYEDSGHVVCAAQPVGRGELIISDVPWMAALPDAELIAPRLTRHLMRMLTNAPLPDLMQYWNRWDEPAIVLRDIAELTRRYEPLTATRWASGDNGLPRAGLTLRGASARPSEHIVISTGRIDMAGPHDGIPPEPMTIFMKWLAREAREQSTLYNDLIGQRAITWLFESAAGTQYVSQYSAADAQRELPPPRVTELRLRLGPPRTAQQAAAAGIWGRLTELPPPRGVFGDDSFHFLTAIADAVRNALIVR